MKKRLFMLAATGMCCAALATLLVAGALRAAPAPAPRTGDLQVKILLEDGKEFRSGSLFVGDRKVELSKGTEATAAVEKLPVRRYAVSAEAFVKRGWFRPDLRYVGVVEAAVARDRMTDVTVTLSPVEDINAFCLQCHPDPGEPAKPGQIVRDLHVSGVPLGKRYVEQVEKFNDAQEKLARQKKAHYPPLVIEQRQVEEKGRKVKRMVFTCESCHTLHLATPSGSYTRAPFKDKPDLCIGCHY